MRKKIEKLYLNINDKWSDEDILEYLCEIIPMVPDDDYIQNYQFIRWLEKRIDQKKVKNRIRLINKILK